MSDDYLKQQIKNLENPIPRQEFVTHTLKKIQALQSSTSPEWKVSGNVMASLRMRRFWLFLSVLLVIGVISTHVYKSRDDDLNRLDGMALTSSLVM